ncbi:Endocuticle structural glycoprotein SgAbd-1 [Frankliniella fusca]|uniref:Endocuticle structural glycoprotein SgAbd-1 n=3 Tax=Arthropoda TaxID=6656 RepID=A0AAE1LRP4_9NEOP|nr:Endocuticle structural glycoprotein SgAbd-1 [Frankliniella fusca]
MSRAGVLGVIAAPQPLPQPQRAVPLIAAFVAVAAARPQEYHDDVFHFSTKVNPGTFSRSSVVSQAVPQYQQYQQKQVVVKSVPQYQQQVVVKSVPQYQQQQVVVKSAPVYSQVQHVQHVVEQPSTVLFRSVEQEVPAVHTVHTHHVHQPVYSQVSSVHQVAAPVVARTSFVPQYDSVSVHSAAQPKFKILKQIQEFDPVGIYRVNFETENGIQSAETGSVKDIQAKEGPVAAKEGSYTYTGPDGVQYTVNWIADEYGFRASGAHLPVAPEVPAEIQRSLELIASQPQKYDDNGNPIGQF